MSSSSSVSSCESRAVGARIAGGKKATASTGNHLGMSEPLVELGNLFDRETRCLERNERGGRKVALGDDDAVAGMVERPERPARPTHGLLGCRAGSGGKQELRVDLRLRVTPHRAVRRDQLPVASD